jgi:hypothetical protein
MTPESLRQMLSDFLNGARTALVVEDGAIAFDLAESKYSISGEYNKQMPAATCGQASGRSCVGRWMRK